MHDESEYDDIEAAAVALLEANQRQLTEHALAQGWEMDVDMEECDGCGEQHINESWWWGHGWLFVTIDSFVVSLDTDPEDITSDLMSWECETWGEAMFLLDLLSPQWPATTMPHYDQPED